MKSNEILESWPKEGLETVQACPVCGNIARVLLYSDLTDRVFYCAPGKWCLYKCLKCESAYLDPRPTPLSIGQAYSDYYTHKSSAEVVNYLAMSFLQRFRRALHNGYVNSRYNAHLNFSSLLGGWIVPILFFKKGEINHKYRNLPPLPAGGGKVLDIGCGSGEFLAAAAQIGWESFGVDPDPRASAQKTGYKVLQGNLPGIDFPDNYFDVITLSHVIEHTHDPVASLKEIKRLLKPGGLVWLATPNLNSYGHLYFNKDYVNLDPPRHLVMFTHDSIARLISEAGFKNMFFCSMHHQAKDEFVMSHKVVLGKKPFTINNVVIPILLTVLALIADIVSTVNYKRRELIVLSATKPL